MSAELTDWMVKAADLAVDFGISDTEVGKLARRGILPREPNPVSRRESLYPYRACVKAYVGHLKSQELAAHQALIEARGRQADIKAKREQLRLEIEGGVMVRRDLVFAAFEPVLVNYRQSVLSRPSRLERRLARAKSREARIRILEDDSWETLSTLAELLQNAGNGQNGSAPSKKTL